MRRLLSLRKNSEGSAAVEFALVGPVFLGMFMGVLQIGVGMWNYNALRGISADVARYAVVNYQTANRLSVVQLQNYATGVATTAPYGLLHERYVVTVAPATTQRIAGATEYTMTMTYDVPTFLGVLGIDEIPLSYSRPIFVIAAS